MEKANPMNRRDDLVRLLRVIYGMAQKGTDAPNAAYRWCERIDEVMHDPNMADEYVEYAMDIPQSISALIAQQDAAQKGGGE